MMERSKSGACTLPYPERFHEAVKFVEHPPKGAIGFTDDERLVFYALQQQATVGPCTETKPWGWNVVESAKWQSWSQLQNMSSIEAMRLYVRVVDEAQPNWWSLVEAAAVEEESPPEQGTAAESGSNGAAAGIQQLIVAAGKWSEPEVAAGKRPPPRYEHAVAAVDTRFFVVGGNCGGRYLSDVWVLNLDTLTWQPVARTKAAAEHAEETSDGSDAASLLAPAFPPCAGHVLVPWEDSLYCIGGHTKAQRPLRKGDPPPTMAVWKLALDTMRWTPVTPSGPTPPSRGGHTGTLIGSRVYIFGGEDAGRRPQADLFCLDLAELAWVGVEPSGPGPSARSAHCATAVGASLLLFGGGSVAHCYNDLWRLDTEAMAWSQPATEGPAPSPRAGHAGDVLNGLWYIAGGGNNTRGCTDVVALDVRSLSAPAPPANGSDEPASPAPLRWLPVCDAEPRSPLACEGLSLLALPFAGVLTAFGGYNGKYLNSLHVFKPDATPEASAPEPVSEPPAVAKASPEPKRLDAAARAESPGRAPSPSKPHANGTAPQLTDGKKQAPASTATPSLPPAAASAADSEAARLRAELAARAGEAEAARREAAMAKETAAHEMALMRRQLASAQTGQADAEKAAEELRAALGGEQKRAMRLEVELAELRQRLALVADLERELEHYRQLEKEAQASKAKAGLWGYISGAQ